MMAAWVLDYTITVMDRWTMEEDWINFVTPFDESEFEMMW
jgi:hypothetical protein